MRDSIEWCETMIRRSGLTVCKPMFAQIAEELQQLRAQRAGLLVLVRQALEYAEDEDRDLFCKRLRDAIAKAERAP